MQTLEPHQREVTVIRGNFSNEYSLYENGNHFVKATFLSWNKNGQATHISVRSNFIQVMKVFFCAELDQLEISGIKGLTTQPFIDKLKKCRINIENVVIIIYKNENEFVDNKFECYEVSDEQPEVKKGNILVGQ